ncbi:MAG: hypothetical protein GX766_01665 [Firmicutes bacterium]|jgi:UDP-N-acetylmuramyl pentapeptide phosphotransferase/UDP-N-acetylglucosamine-1-phosphate transferase|nr:hypothetical protein [Bacillota bacterium]HOB21232.1 hypothetical protein [Bacillota bacterium]
MEAAILFVLGGLFTLLVRSLWLGMLKNCGLVALNYQQKEIPVSSGPLFLGSTTFALWLGELVGISSLSDRFSFLFLLAALVLLGFIDDCLGGKDAKGFRGHFRSLFRGQLTTGGMKAIAGGFFSLVVATTLAEEPARILLAALLIAFSANTLNLLDLRPGRALKSFWLGSILLLWTRGGNLPLYPLLGASVIWAPADFKGRAMLGDSGANCLGAALGYSLAVSLSLPWQLAVVLFLLLLNLISEKYSFSAIIEGNPFLRFLDRLGRSQ